MLDGHCLSAVSQPLRKALLSAWRTGLLGRTVTILLPVPTYQPNLRPGELQPNVPRSQPDQPASTKEPQPDLVALLLGQEIA